MREFNKGGQMNLQQQANNVAAQGRYGDSMLMHVNPLEVKGLSQVAPITINPQTGQPEAFAFLAPLLGSMVGSSLLGGTIGTLGASALGSGLAQWAATGDLKKGLLAGITGYGIGSALQGAGAANAATAGTENVIGSAAQQDLLSGDITNILTQNPELIESAANPALNTMGQMNLDSIMAGNPVQANIAAQGARASADYLAQDPKLFQSAKDAFSAGPTQGFQNLAAGATDPLALTTMVGGMAPTAIMESEEEFARQMAQRQAEEEERKRQNFLMNPEPILYSAQGGTTNFNEGGSTEIDKGVEMDSNLLAQQMMANGGRIGFNGKAGSDTDVNMFSGDQQRFTPARQTYDINPAFMAGFQPETMYFNPATINQPATATTTGAIPSVTDTYTGSKGGYNMMGVTEAPLQTIDPYAAFTGPAPQGLVETGFAPYPEPVAPPPEIDPGIPIDIPIDGPWDGPWNVPINFNPLNGDFTPSTMERGRVSPEDIFNKEPRTDGDMRFLDAVDDTGVPIWGGKDMLSEPALTTPDMQFPLTPPIVDMPDLSPIGEPIAPVLSPESIVPPVVPQVDPIDLIMEESTTDAGIEDAISNLGVMQPYTYIEETPLAPPVVAPPPVATPNNFKKDVFNPRSRVGRYAGGDTKKKKYQTGDMTRIDAMEAQDNSNEMMQDPLTQEVISFIAGENDNQQAVNDFVNRYGTETFTQLRDYVLRMIAGENVQTEGQIAGMGNSGMADDIPGVIGDKEKIAVSQDEFIVPADVVAGLGDGSSDAGSERLYEMMDRVRMAKTGGKTQPPPINVKKVMPA